MIPLLGYTWFFAWKFVDTVAAQEAQIEHGELRHARWMAIGWRLDGDWMAIDID